MRGHSCLCSLDVSPVLVLDSSAILALQNNRSLSKDPHLAFLEVDCPCQQVFPNVVLLDSTPHNGKAEWISKCEVSIFTAVVSKNQFGC